MQTHILVYKRLCSKYNLDMKLVNNIAFQDDCCWSLPKEEITNMKKKINIRSNNIIEDIKCNVRIKLKIEIYQS